MPEPSSSPHDAVLAAAELIGQADGLLITAGAGIGIDSGLPDFRGDQGFWHAYPALGSRGMRFHDIANPAAFRAEPRLAWGFYGHRLALYRATIPHRGFGILRTWLDRMPFGGAVFTSNVDGQFQAAGFAGDLVAECHGSIHHLQCTDNCGAAPWPAQAVIPEVDVAQCRLTSPLPLCPGCGALARPNILMFGDWDWDDRRAARQMDRIEAKLARMRRPLVMEIGAGTAIPTVRRFGEQLGCPLIRINPAQPAVARRSDLSLPMGALQALTAIDAALANGAGR